MSEKQARYGWESNFPTFSRTPARVIRGRLEEFVRDAGERQVRAWDESIPPFQREVDEVLSVNEDAATYSTILEYELPLESRRPDVVRLAKSAVVILELKGKLSPSQADLDQASAYARDLRCYHRECEHRPVVPIVVPTRAKGYIGDQAGVQIAGPDALDSLVDGLAEDPDLPPLSREQFLAESAYCPLPTLVKAARELFNSGNLRTIRRARAATDPPVEEISRIIHEAAATRTRRLVLVTGIPGSGKTLVGLRIVHAHFLDDLAVPRANGKPTAPAIFLSGNGPLGDVLQYELRGAGGGGRTFVRGVKDYVKMYSASTVPSLSEIILGKVKIGQLRPVRMEDLLGRASVVFDSSDRELFDAYCGKQILVTGAAGSIGSELVRQLTEFKPRSILLMDKDENGLYEIGLEVRDSFPGELVEILTDVRDRDRLKKMFQKWRPEAVFHAAAYKHVPMMEYYPSESVLTNIGGTKNVLELADEFGAGSFLLISTDKAVNPTSVMGASKRVGEMLVRFRALHGNGKMRLCCVRFGNVLGSRGSVVPLFQKRIAEGKNLQVTHPEMKRYFMTIPEAVQLVIQAGSLGRQGETFVLDMGNPVKIVDLAKDLIEQSGLVPGKDIQIEFSGLRPGEKLFEELMLSADSGAKHTKYPKIFVDRAIDYDWGLLDRAIKALEEAARAEDVESILRVFESLDIGYRRRTISLSSAGSAHRS
jgi:nucleoside-diphosphate-sugar epimerase